MILAQNIINGLLIGGLYGLAGVGFSLVWGVMGLINMAHGALIMVGAYVAYWAFTALGIDPFVGIVPAMIVLFLLGYATQRWLVNPVLRGSLIMVMMLTFGIDLVLQNIGLWLFTADYRSVTTAYSGAGLAMGPIVIPYTRLGIGVLAVLIAVALHQVLTRTRLGRAIQATAQNREAAQLTGVPIHAIYALTFGLGAAVAGAAGAMVSTIQAISPTMGTSFLTKAFVVTVLGGLGHVPGAVLGGLVLGLAESLGATFFGPGLQEATGFVLLVIILILRPQGLFGRKVAG